MFSHSFIRGSYRDEKGLEAQKSVVTYSGHSRGVGSTNPVNSIAVRPNSTGKPMVAAAAGDRSIRFWQRTIGRMMRYVRLESEALDIAWINETLIVASCVDGKARVVDSENVKVIQTTLAIEGWAYTIAAHPSDGTVAIAGSEGQLRRAVLDESNE